MNIDCESTVSCITVSIRRRHTELHRNNVVRIG